MDFLKELLAKFEVEVTGAEELEKVDDAMGGAEQSADGFDASMVALAATAVAVAAGVAFATVKVVGWVNEVSASNDETAKLSRTMGISTDEIQKWTFAVQESGGSQSDVTAAMKRLTRAVFDAQRSAGPASEAFERLGVATQNADGTTRDLQDIMIDTAAGLGATANAGDKLALAQETLGRGALKMIPAFKGTKEEMRGVLDTAGELNGVISAESFPVFEEYNDNLNQMGNQFLAISADIAAFVLPIFKEVVTRVRDMMISFRAFIKEQGILQRLAKMGAVGALVAGFKALQRILKAITSNWRAIGRGMMKAVRFLRPFVAAIAKFLIWALILDDIIVFLQGGESALGHFLDKILGAGTATAVLEFILDLWDSMKLGINLAAEAIQSLLGVFGLLDEGAAKSGANWAGSWQPVVTVLQTIFGLIGDVIKAFTEMSALEGIAEILFPAIDANANAKARANAKPIDIKARDAAFLASGGNKGGNNSVTVNLSGKQTPATVRTATSEANRLAGGQRQRSANALVRGQ